MCGIAGIYNLNSDKGIDPLTLKRMIAIVAYRGPDEFGFYLDPKIGLGHSRLSIIDLSGGQQPMHNEDKSLWVIFNGEIFNYIELREGLLARGHVFYTHSDTEVLLHLYEEKGPDFLKELNGQFAIALWDKRQESLLLARDRMGIRPLFYTQSEGKLLFASEIKSIFVDKKVKRELDPLGLDQLFTFWANIAPRTVFKDIRELPAAHYLVASRGKLIVKRYWDLEFSQINSSEDECAERLLYLLKDSIRLRLRADVPVAAYLSGGIDSSLISSLVKKFYNSDLQTFSISFSDPDFDEGAFQLQMAEFIHTRHSQVKCSYFDIGGIMPEVVWHAEKPLIRTAPAPLFLLAKLVRENNIKVVLTGEGADEILGGYDLFREAKIRRFWARFPDSRLRPLLIRELYSYIPNWPRKTSAFLEGFYRKNLNPTDSWHYSHTPRWETAIKVKSLFSQELKSGFNGYDPVAEFDQCLPGNFRNWEALAQAQYIEIQTLLSGNLLSSQGDRMMMANSVEGRLPFLDYRLVEFAFNLPAKFKIKVLKEKYLLKKISREFLPLDIISRVKQAYRAPDSASFLRAGSLEYVNELLSAENLRDNAYFDPRAVTSLLGKCRAMESSQISARDNLAMVSVVTTLLLDKLYIRDFDFRIPAELPEEISRWKAPV
ncbi:MAG: asparagine synthase (glutamine-hydrolyzing) [Candidatus Omnitrophica bacterium]|nr:asparagine synthase (glutamine-hydrolyzing) [Candidatus Omnitrophota bacterium]